MGREAVINESLNNDKVMVALENRDNLFIILIMNQ